MDEKQLQALKEKLPRNWSSIVAAELKVTPATVWNTMRGKCHRMDIIDCVIELARKTTLAKQQQIEAIRKLTQP